MINLDIKKSNAYLALKWEPFNKTLKVLRIVFIFIFPLFLYIFFLSFRTYKVLLAISIIFFIIFIKLWVLDAFFNYLKSYESNISLKKINPKKHNVADFMDFEVARAFSKGTNPFYHLISDNWDVNFILSRLLISKKKLKENLLKSVTDTEQIVLAGLETAVKNEHSLITAGDMLCAMADHVPVFKKLLIENNIKKEDIENLSWWLETVKEKRSFFNNLSRFGTLAKEWTSGYTVVLDKYGIDITEGVKRNLPLIVGHEREIGETERILSRRQKNNVLMVGEPGTGRKSIVSAIAKNSFLGQGLKEINYKRVVELDMTSFLAGIKDIDEVEEVLSQIFDEVNTAGNIILVIDEFHNYIEQSFKPGIVDISGILARYLASPNFRLIAITTYDGLHRYIEKNPSILSLLSKVEVSEISERETLMLLENLSLYLERKYKKMISYPAIREIISLSKRYMPSLYFPEKAIQLLDDVVVYVATATKDRVILPSHVSKVISAKIEIPVGEMEEKEKETLLNLEDLIHERIINQEEAVHEISTALRRARSDISVRTGPMGAFLFLGPTGVGKTETSKALAEIYFGDEKKIIRLDMSEFQDKKDIPRLIGDLNNPGLLTTPVKENPFSVVLLDELEKAEFNVLNLFLQVLDEGYLNDGAGKKVSFNNTIIIATSNAGYKLILDAVENRVNWKEVKQDLLDYIFKERVFQPEFINRFDAVVVFSPLSKDNLLKISGLMLGKLRVNLSEKGVELIVTEELKRKIAELGYNPVFGAREMRRVIQEKVENVLASALLSGELKRGDRVEIDNDFNLKIV